MQPFKSVLAVFSFDAQKNKHALTKCKQNCAHICSSNFSLAVLRFFCIPITTYCQSTAHIALRKTDIQRALEN